MISFSLTDSTDVENYFLFRVKYEKIWDGRTDERRDFKGTNCVGPKSTKVSRTRPFVVSYTFLGF